MPAAPAFTTDPTSDIGSTAGTIDLSYVAATTEQVSYVVVATAGATEPANHAALVAQAAVSGATNGKASNVDGTGGNVDITVTDLTAGAYTVYWVIRTGSLESAIITTTANCGKLV